MSKTKRLVISLSVVAFFIISAVVAVVAVFASEQNVITRNVNSVYKIYGATGSVSASYVYGDRATNTYNSNAEYFTTTGDVQGAKKVYFDDQDYLVTEMLVPQNDIVLTKQQNSVIIKYDFENIGPQDYTATFTIDSESRTNCLVEYSIDGVNWETRAVQLKVNNIFSENNTVSYYVRIYKQNLNLESSYSANLFWTIVERY